MATGLSVTREGNIAELIIDQPRKRNAISYDMWSAIPAIVADVEADDSIKLLIVRGNGSHFSAGADISEFEARRTLPADAHTYNAAVEHAAATLSQLRKPSIAMIEGYCIGVGCELALACDLRFAADDARMGITPAKLGIVYSFPSTRQLVNLVGPSFAKYMLFSGAHLDADEALRVGLVDQVFPAAELAKRTTEFAETTCSRSQVSVQGAKTIINKIAGGLVVADEEAASLPIKAVESEDYREGVRAFLEKRTPHFTAR